MTCKTKSFKLRTLDIHGPACSVTLYLFGKKFENGKVCYSHFKTLGSFYPSLETQGQIVGQKEVEAAKLSRFDFLLTQLSAPGSPRMVCIRIINKHCYLKGSIADSKVINFRQGIFFVSKKGFYKLNIN